MKVGEKIKKCFAVKTFPKIFAFMDFFKKIAKNQTIHLQTLLFLDVKNFNSF